MIGIMSLDECEGATCVDTEGNFMCDVFPVTGLWVPVSLSVKVRSRSSSFIKKKPNEGFLLYLELICFAY